MFRPLVIFVACLCFLGLTNLVCGQVPQLVNYQGRVIVDGVNFDGSGQFKFAFVNSTGNTTYWSNDGTSAEGSQPTAAVTLTVTKGLYSVLLGDATLPNMTIVPATVFTHGDVHLRIWFNDGTHGFEQLAPDKRIAAVGYALMAADVPDGIVTSNKIADGAVTSAKLAPGVVQSGNLAAGSVGNDKLVNSGMNITTGTGLDGGGNVALGGNLTLTNTGVLSIAGGGGITVSGSTGAIALGSNATSANSPSTLVTRDQNGNFSAGTITAALNGNATTATNFTGSLAGDVVGIQSATTISSTTVTSKLLTGFASTSGTLTAADTILSAIGKLDGNVALKAPLQSPHFIGAVALAPGSASAPPLTLTAGNLLSDPMGGALEFDGSSLYLTSDDGNELRRPLAFADTTFATANIADNAITTPKLAPASVTSSRLASDLTLSGITTGTFVGNLQGAATSAASFTGSLAGDVSGTQSGTIVQTVGGVTASNIGLGVGLANSATSTNTANQLVRRDENGNFSANTITANLNGNAASATTATTAGQFTGMLSGDVVGTQSATSISDGVVTGKSLSGLTNSAGTVTAVDTILTAIGKLVSNQALKAPSASPSFTGTVTLPVGNATSVPLVFQDGALATGLVPGAVEFDGDSLYLTSSNPIPTRKQLAFSDTILAGSQIADGSVGSAKLSPNLNLAGTTSGSFSGDLAGNASTATTAQSFTGMLSGDVSGTQTATVVTSIGGASASSVATGADAANQSTADNVPDKIVKRDASGNFSAGTITATLNGNASSATSANNFIGSLMGDVTGTQGATVISEQIVTGKALTGFVSQPGTVTSNDTVLSAIGRLDGNVSTLSASVAGLQPSTTPSEVYYRVFSAGSLVDGIGNTIATPLFLPISSRPSFSRSIAQPIPIGVKQITEIAARATTTVTTGSLTLRIVKRDLAGTDTVLATVQKSGATGVATVTATTSINLDHTVNLYFVEAVFVGGDSNSTQTTLHWARLKQVGQ